MVSSASILLLALAQASPGATAVALLTAVGDAAEEQKREVDAGLREALEGEGDFSLLSAAETREQLSSLADMGLICLPEDTPCFVKLGMAAGVDLVLVPVASEADGKGLTVQVHVVDVAAGGQARLVSAVVRDAGKQAWARLASQALGLMPADPPPPAEGEGEGEGEGEPPPAPAAAGPSLGVIVTGVGGALTGIGLAGALVCDLIYGDVLHVASAQTRREVIQPLGAVMWISSAVGVGVLGSGIALMLTAPPETPPE